MYVLKDNDKNNETISSCKRMYIHDMFINICNKRKRLRIIQNQLLTLLTEIVLF